MTATTGLAPTTGQFVWYELETTDIPAAVAFYTQVMGWSVSGEQVGPEAYPHFATAQGQLGGAMALPEAAKAMGAPPFWLGYVAVPDVVASVRQAEALGARVYVPLVDLGATGKFAVLADPQGATFAVHQSAQPGSARDNRQPGEVNWHELAVPDPKAALAFYGALFGWQELDAMDMGPMGMYHLFGAAGSDKQLGGIFTRPPAMPVSAWLYYVMVENVETQAARAVSLGARVLHGPMDVPGGARIVQLQDPQGAHFAVVGG